MKNILCILTLILIFSCDSKDDENNPKILESIEITSSNGNEIDINNGTTSLTAQGFDQFNDPIEITTTLSWSSNNNNVTVNQNGLVTAQTIGTSNITVTAGGITAMFTITVVDNIPRVLDRIQIKSSNGDQLFLTNGSTTLTVEGFDQFNDPYTITTTIQWSSNNNNVAVNPNGEAIPLAAGTSLITATVEDIIDTFEILVIDNTIPAGTMIYVSDAGNFNNPPWQILKYDENGENPEVFIDAELAWPQDILFLEDQNVVLISNLNSGRITKHNADTGEFIEDFANGISGPTRMKIGPDNLLYVLQWTGNGLVLRYQLDGTFVDEFTTVAISQSIGLDWDTDNNLYVSSFGGKTVRKFGTTGEDLGLFINDSSLSGPTNIWFDESGALFVVDWSGSSVNKYDVNGVFIEQFITGLSQAEGVDFLPNGNILIGNGGTAAIKFYNKDGIFIEDLVASGSGNLLQPNAVVIRNQN